MSKSFDSSNLHFVFNRLKTMNNYHDEDMIAMMEQLADSSMIINVVSEMEKELATHRAGGRGRWWDDARCDVNDLEELLHSCIERRDWISAMNLIGMIHVREQIDGVLINQH